MAMRRGIFILAFFITLSLLLSLLLIGGMLGDKRQETINGNFESIYRDFDDIQKLTLMSEVYGNQMACLAYSSKLRDFDTRLWDLGLRLEQYRIASEEFSSDPYYLDQKKTFNEKEFTYLMLLKQIEQRCEYEQPVIAFFYRNSRDCAKCDDQSYVLTDIKRDLEDQVAVFSFDMDLNLTTLNLLAQYHNITQYPCVMVDDSKMCGMHDAAQIIRALCQKKSYAFC